MRHTFSNHRTTTRRSRRAPGVACAAIVGILAAFTAPAATATAPAATATKYAVRGRNTASGSRRSVGRAIAHETPGSYTVDNANATSSLGHFFVSAGGTQLQDVWVSTTPSCTPSYSLGSDHIQFATIAIKSGGFSSGSVTEHGVVDSEMATFTYTFTGHFHGTSSEGVERVAGQLRENVSFNNGNPISCTTGPETWTAARDAQGTQTTSPSPGSYSVDNANATSSLGSFSVASGGAELQNVSVSTSLACTPSYNAGSDHIQFASIAISHESFTGSSTQPGTFHGFSATFTYTFNGHFHGKTAGGIDRFAGQLREDVTFNNGNQISCTTGPESWTATGS